MFMELTAGRIRVAHPKRTDAKPAVVLISPEKPVPDYRPFVPTPVAGFSIRAPVPGVGTVMDLTTCQRRTK
jgi:hypothetical protein